MLFLLEVSFLIFIFFFFNDTATTEIYTLSLHDALPICLEAEHGRHGAEDLFPGDAHAVRGVGDRKSTRLNSSHLVISYAVFCLKKKKISVKETCTRTNANYDATSTSVGTPSRHSSSCPY